MNVLIVKLSSLGDVVHSMPAIQDLRSRLPGVQIDWVVERSFAPLVSRCEGVTRIIPCELRRWRKAPFHATTRAQWQAFRQDLQAQTYDAVIDLQGLTKSAFVARLARLAPGGRRVALANRTDGSAYEAPTRWVADLAVRIKPHIHAVQRSRELCARALGYEVPEALRFGLRAVATPELPRDCVALVHGTSRSDKCWPVDHWLELGRRLIAQGHPVALPHGSEEERVRSVGMAEALGPAGQVWPRLALGELSDRLAACAGVIGVDSGLSHIAVALDLPHVQIYNFDTAWRTGPPSNRWQCSVYAVPCPSVDQVWGAWQGVRGRG